jgi:hypothetical protein
MIGTTFCGRLGNQLFQLQFFRYVQSQNPGKLVVIPNPHHAKVFRYFDLGKYNYLGKNPYVFIMKVVYRLIPYKEVYISNLHVPQPLAVTDGTVYHGFHQTEWYRQNTQEPMLMKVKQKFVKQFNEQYGEIFRTEKTIAIQIRRTDYLSYGKRDISVPIDFFQKRLAEIESTGEKYRVFFCSDDIPYVKAAFENKPNYVFSEHDEITDFQLIMNADVCIISNSTFSWWAAYLSEKDNLVIAPKNWMGAHIGKEHPKRVMTSRFKWYDI